VELIINIIATAVIISNTVVLAHFMTKYFPDK